MKQATLDHARSRHQRFVANAAAVLRQAVREPERERIREAMNFIEANVCERLSVESIAKQVAMSPSHFAHRFKEIASVRDTSERTAREQARAVYKKAGVAGRSELAGWFIDDLLPGGDG